MEKYCCFLLFVMLLSGSSRAQEYEASQLILDAEKLIELKQIYQDMKDGYQQLLQRYSAIRDIAQGNFNLHKAFLDGLLAVSPTVRNYERIGGIVDLQVKIVQQCRSAWGRLQQDRNLRPEELAALGQAYAGVLTGCTDDLGDLVTLVTNGTLRASDAERMEEIDTIYYRMRAKLTFAARVSNEATLLSLQRRGEMGDVDVLKQLFGLK